MPRKEAESAKSFVVGTVFMSRGMAAGPENVADAVELGASFLVHRDEGDQRDGSARAETAEAVPGISRPGDTQLKLGVNER